MVTVTIKHVRQAHMCAAGTRAFFEKHNLDYTDFLKNGIDSEVLKTLNDSMSDKVVEIALNGRE